MSTYEEPNKFARPTGIDIRPDLIVFHGYQEYQLSRHSIRALDVDQSLLAKQKLLAPYFTPRFLAERSMLDIGANGGFYSFWALQKGAERVIALDIDPDYLKMIEQGRDRLGFQGLDITRDNIHDWQQSVDIVLALALVHWIYSCTSIYGSLDAVVGKLASLANYMAIIEWVEPGDQAVEFFHHLDWNKESTDGKYCLEAFEAALDQHFVRKEVIGQTTPTRRLYAAYKTQHEIDLSCPLPRLYPGDELISSRWLARHNQIEYWSQIYRLENTDRQAGDFRPRLP